MERTPRSMIFGMQLRKLRKSAGLKADYVARTHLGCSPSKLYMVEAGTRRINGLETSGLVGTVYNRPDLVDRMEEIRQKIDADADVPIKDDSVPHPNTTMTHELELESMAAYGFIIDQVPKLAQTYEYMMAQHRMAGLNTIEADGLAQAGLARQGRFFSMQQPPMTRIIITEGALHRAERIEGQLALFAERAAHYALDFLLLPHSVGPHPQFSSFTLIEFQEFPTILYNDQATGASLITNETEIQTAKKRWDHVSTMTINAEETLDTISRWPHTRITA